MWHDVGQSIYSSLAQPLPTEAEEVDALRTLSLTVLFAELPAGFLGKSHQPLVAGDCNMVLSAGDRLTT